MALEAEPDVGVDADVRVAEEFLDHDEVATLFQEQGGDGVPEVVEADGPESSAVEKATEVAGEVAGVERPAGGGGEGEAVVRPARSAAVFWEATGRSR